MDIRRVASQREILLLRHVLFDSTAKVIFITGAGISVKSGIPLYRSDKKLIEASGKDDKLDVAAVNPTKEAQFLAEKNTPPTTTGEAFRRRVGNEADLYVAISDDEWAEPSSKQKSKLTDDVDVVISPTVNKIETKEVGSEEPQAIWDAKLEAMCMKSSFLVNPRGWYQYFWFDTHHVEAFLKASPNESHVAIGLLCAKFPERIKCVTQNVDNLHTKGGCPDSSLVEIHGRLGIYRCTNDDCPNATLNVIHPEQLAFMTAEEEANYQRDVRLKGEVSLTVAKTLQRVTNLYDEEAKKGTSKVEDFDLPCCALCRSPVLPLTLLFDEYYQTHDFFRFTTAQRWIEESDVVVFCGTSFSVYFTELAVSLAKQGRKLVFNINIKKEEDEFADFHDVEDANRNPERYLSPISCPSVEKRPIFLEFQSAGDSGSSSDGEAEEEDLSAKSLKHSVESASPTTEFKIPPGPAIQHVVHPADVALLAAMRDAYRFEVHNRLKQIRDDRRRSLWRVIT